MLTALRIGNFKAFAETQRIPIRPLTLIYGANSSGKSSVLHSLLLACHAHETGDLDVHRTNVGGESVDLGGFRQYVYKREANRRVEWAIDLDTSSFKDKLAELFAPVNQVTVLLNMGIGLDDQDRPLPGSVPEILNYEIIADGHSLLRMSGRKDGKLQLDRLDHEHPVFREVIKAMVLLSTTTETIHSEDFEGLNEAIADLVPEIVALRTRLFPEGLMESNVFNPSGQMSLFPISKGRRKEDLNTAVRSFLPRKIDELLRGIGKTVANELLRLKYLGPLRSYPPRHLAFAQHHDPNWFAGGGYAWDVVRRDAEVRKLVNQWLNAKDRLQTRYELRIRHLLTIDDLDQDYTAIIESLEQRFTSDEAPFDGDLFGEIYSALEKIKDNEATLTDIQELNLVDMRSNTIVSHRDVGIGVSQVLPVLVSAYAWENKIIAIEQPEIHLHPALQADLGDVFIQSALGKANNSFLLETHSEHLLLRIMRRIRETSAGKLPEGCTPITPDDVMVLFVVPDGTRSVIHEMPINKHGDLIKPWPGGFFEEDFQELF
jgi:hypothetical protein